ALAHAPASSSRPWRRHPRAPWRSERDRHGLGSWPTAKRRDEPLHVHPLGAETQTLEHRPELPGHTPRTPDEHLVRQRCPDPRPEQEAHLAAIEAAVEDGHILLLTRQHVEDREAIQIAVLEIASISPNSMFALERLP